MEWYVIMFKLFNSLLTHSRFSLAEGVLWLCCISPGQNDAMCRWMINPTAGRGQLILYWNLHFRALPPPINLHLGLKPLRPSQSMEVQGTTWPAAKRGRSWIRFWGTSEKIGKMNSGITAPDSTSIQLGSRRKTRELWLRIWKLTS